MIGRGLLSRIVGAGPSDELQAILANVRAVLNTRAGESVCTPKLGVPDFADLVHTFPSGAQQLAASIRATLLEHEPRLRGVVVRHVAAEGELVLRFEISAHRGTRPVRMTTTVRPGGRVDVTG
jgi:type VI secretion system lysozyme-like protein